jgi:hypothetical protein
VSKLSAGEILIRRSHGDQGRDLGDRESGRASIAPEQVFTPFVYTVAFNVLV